MNPTPPNAERKPRAATAKAGWAAAPGSASPAPGSEVRVPRRGGRRLFHLASPANPCEGSGVNVVRQTWRVWVPLLLLLGGASCLGAAGKPAASPESPNYSSFKLIPERNIFNQNRSVKAPRPVVAKAPRVESFGLTGTLCSEKGAFAFFDGTSSTYRKVLKPEGTIAGYKVAEIAPDVAKLEAGKKKLELHVGEQLRREDKGEWEVAAAPVTYASSSSRKADSSSKKNRSSKADARHKPAPKHGKPGRSDSGQLSKNDMKALIREEKEVYSKGEMKDFPKDEMNSFFKEEMKGYPKQDAKGMKEELQQLMKQREKEMK